MGKFAAVAKRKSCYKHNQLIQRGEMSKKVKEDNLVLALLEKYEIPMEVVLGKKNIPELNKLIEKAGISPKAKEDKLIKAFRRRHQNRGYSSKKRDEYTCEHLILEEEVKYNKKKMTK